MVPRRQAVIIEETARFRVCFSQISYLLVEYGILLQCIHTKTSN
jgi:hypothetical protein